MTTANDQDGAKGQAGGPAKGPAKGSEVGDGQAQVIAFLSRPEAYGLPTDCEVQIIETHASMVFLAGERAYKLKKAIHLPYMDFSTLDRRLEAARAELTVNRRFTPDLYLGLGAVMGTADGLFLMPPSETLDGSADGLIEPLVVTTRFDQDAQMDHVAAQGALDALLADRLGQMAARVMKAAPVRDTPWTESFEAVIAESLEELEGRTDLFDASQIMRLRTELAEWSARHRDLMKLRERSGKIRHGHGDLHLRNIVMIEGTPLPFDALEFDENLAITDSLYDLAFLVMDLHHRSLPGAAARVLSIALTVTDDFAGACLMPGYCAVRAMIRAKIAATMESQGDTPEIKKTHRDEALAYFTLAARLLAPSPPVLSAIGGLSGTGKTTVAFALAPQAGPCAAVLRSDVIRKALAGVDLFTDAPKEAYGADMSAQVYEKMRTAAKDVLSTGLPVILDATFHNPGTRTACAKLAENLNIPFHGFWLHLPDDTRLARVASRKVDVSDADETVARSQTQIDTGTIDWTWIDASQAIPSILEQIKKNL